MWLVDPTRHRECRRARNAGCAGVRSGTLVGAAIATRRCLPAVLVTQLDSQYSGGHSNGPALRSGWWRGVSTTWSRRVMRRCGRASGPLAEQCYRGVLESVEAGEALFGLGIARWWSGDTDEALRCWERAYAVFRRQSEPGQAVLERGLPVSCVPHESGQRRGRSRLGSSGGELVEEFQLTPMRGWVLLCRAYLANDEAQPQVAERCAREALRPRSGRWRRRPDPVRDVRGRRRARRAGRRRGGRCAARSSDGRRPRRRGRGPRHRRADQLPHDHRVQQGGGHQAGRAVDPRRRRLQPALRLVPSLHHLPDAPRRGAVRGRGLAAGGGGAAGGRWRSAAVPSLSFVPRLRPSWPSCVWRRADSRRRAPPRRLRGSAGDGLRPRRAALGTRRAEASRSRLSAGASATLERSTGSELPCSICSSPPWWRKATATSWRPGSRRWPVLSRVDATLVAAYCQRALGRGMASLGEPSAVGHLEAALAAFGSLGMPYECGRTRLVLAAGARRAGRGHGDR